jgi:hypothetical protein
MSAGFLTVALGLLAYLIYYVLRYVGPLGAALTSAGAGPAPAEGGVLGLAQPLIALAWPMLLVFGLAVASVWFAMHLQQRTALLFDSTLERLDRVRRQAAIGIARSEDPNDVLDETVRGARRALGWSVWMGRSLYLCGLGLFVVAMGAVLLRDQVDGLTVALASVSLAVLIAASLTSTHRSLARAVERVTYLETALVGYRREASIVEDYLYLVLERASLTGDFGGAREAVEHGVDQLAALLAEAEESMRTLMVRAQERGRHPPGLKGVRPISP